MLAQMAVGTTNLKFAGGSYMTIFTTQTRSRYGWLTDAVLLILVFIVFYVLFRLGEGMVVPFSTSQQPVVDLAPDGLPYYAGRSLLRMFLAFGASLLFSLVYGYVAAKSRLAGYVLVPLLDILQSIPVLGFLSATIAAFIAFFPGSLFGVECASIFAIFTGQAWNMTFSFYHSLTTLPRELQEAAEMLHLNWWQRFRRLELPAATMGLIWNGMMSFGGGWFFLAASEAITVMGEDIHLPGVGSYLAAAVDAGDMQAMLYAMLTMLVMILLVDQLFWRPLVVWGQKFKLETSASEVQPTSFVYDILQGSRLIWLFRQRVLAPVGRIVNKGIDWLVKQALAGAMHVPIKQSPAAGNKILAAAAAVFFLALIGRPALEAWSMITSRGLADILMVLELGALTWSRVMVALIVGALWTIPVGVWIGTHPRIAGRMQPLVLLAASFPANMLFPFLIVFFVWSHVDFEYGSILLMLLGTQWYILFNVIAGAMSLPNDLLEASSMLQLSGWKKWRTVILPGIFPQLVTGLVTACGGAWNASIVAEIASWRDIDLSATGLGAYISQATAAGNWSDIVIGIMVMCFFVVAFNRLVWQKLYDLSVSKYHIG